MARRADQRRYHYIYKITRTDGSGKYYIGMHSTDDIHDGYFGSGTLLAKSIKKHGKEKHLKEILEFLPSREALKLREKEIVNEGVLSDKLCMNLKVGGEGGQNQSIALSNWKNENYISAQSAGLKKKWTDPSYRCAVLTSTRSSRSLTMSNKHKAGKIKYDTFVDRKHTEETKQKMSQSASGQKNSQFGTCWVNKDLTIKKIKISDIDVYLLNGYTRGRSTKS